MNICSFNHHRQSVLSIIGIVKGYDQLSNAIHTTVGHSFNQWHRWLLLDTSCHGQLLRTSSTEVLVITSTYLDGDQCYYQMPIIIRYDHQPTAYQPLNGHWLSRTAFVHYQNMNVC